MSLQSEKEAITQKLSTDIPEAAIETELETLFTEPEGKIVVLYAGAPYQATSDIPLLSRKKEKRWTIAVTTRDPLKEDIALQLLEKVRDSLQGLQFGYNDNTRLFPDNERFEEFLEGSQVWSYKIDFVCTEIVNTNENNIG